MYSTSALPFSDDPYLHQTPDGRWEETLVKKNSVYTLQMAHPEEFLESLNGIDKLNYAVLISQNFDHARVFCYKKNHRKYPWQPYYVSKWEEAEWKPKFGSQKIPFGQMRDGLYKMWPARPGLVVYDSGSPYEFYERQRYPREGDQIDLEDSVRFVPTLQRIETIREIPAPAEYNEYLGSFSDWISCFTQKGFDRLMKKGFEQRDLAVVMEEHHGSIHGTDSMYALQSKERETIIINIVHYRSLWSVLTRLYQLGRVRLTKEKLSKEGILKLNDKVQTIHAVHGADDHHYDNAFWTLEDFGKNTVLTAPNLFGVYEEIMAKIVGQKD